MNNVMSSGSVEKMTKGRIGIDRCVMSASAITTDDVVAILGPDWIESPVTFASVWATMKIERVWRKVSDFLPDETVYTIVFPLSVQLV